MADMKLLIDTNIILDVMLLRQPFCKNSSEVLKLARLDNIELYLSASAVTDIFYIANRNLKDKLSVIKNIKDLLKIIKIAGVGEDEIIKALDLCWTDFEDSVQYSIAYLANMDGIVTRNRDDYKQSEIPVWSAEEILDKVLNI